MATRILVVDDSAAIRQSVCFILDQAGYETVQAVDGQDGLNKASADNNFQLIITDVNMPNKDGISLVREARGLAGHRFTPIVVLTTESQSSKMEEGKAAGATGWIVKPFNADKLLAVVKKLVG